MSLLFSNFPPLRTRYPSYSEKFKDLLRKSDEMKIATGYISSDSIVELKSIVEINGGPRLDLCIGMHYFDGLSLPQKAAIKGLDETLKSSSLGKVYMVTTFPFHGKIVSFSKNSSVIGSIVGSSNLSNILEGQRKYEADCLIDSGKESEGIKDFIENLILSSSKPYEGLYVKVVQPDNDLLNDQLGVRKISNNELIEACQKLSEISFEIPLKGNDAPKSGLNVFFGEGRKNVQGFVLPRPWYEVELIVPNSITLKPGYPKAGSIQGIGSFSVITDDGWTFRCKVSGDYSKNFRSEDDLKVLGKWIKGRLENSGVLNPGERVTDQTFIDYGRSNISFSKIKDSDTWYLDFGVINE